MSWIELLGPRGGVPTTTTSGLRSTDPAAVLAEAQRIAAGNDAQWGMVAPSPVPPATAPMNTAPLTGLTDEQRSARAIIDNTLAQFGLQGLGDRVWQAILSGQIVPEQITTFIRDTDEYRSRFAGMKPLQDTGQAISEAEYISIERSYAQAARAAGLPTGFYDSPDDFAKLIGGRVSPAEFSERVDIYRQAVHQGPPEVLDELERIYGISEGHLAAYLIDETRALPIIQKQFAAGQRSAAASRTGFGGLARGEAERLVELGVSDREAAEGFGALVDARELFTPLDAGEDAIGRSEQIDAAFSGNPNARRRVEDRKRRRLAQFDAGGSFAGGQQGISGLGSAAT